jgi:diacylglycerol kinase (ATP)
MSACIIYNPSAGSADADTLAELVRRIERRPETELAATRASGDAENIARESLARGHELIVAAGGDGTVHEVVNGIMRGRAPNRDGVTLGVIPLGTGNDLPRTLAIPEDPLEALALLETGTRRRIDLMKVTYNRRRRFGHNVAAGGFTGQVDEVMTDEMKRTWGPLAYIRGAIKVLPDLTHYRTTIRIDGKAAKVVSAMNIIVANGRTAGGGLVVAPGANPEDGLLDVVIVHSGSLAQLTGVAARLLAGDYTNSEIVMHERARRVEVQSHPAIWFNVDGELLTNERIVFSVVPQAINVIIGPGYVPEPQTTRSA